MPLRADAVIRSTTIPAWPTTSPPAKTDPVRVIPTVGAQYRYPFIDVERWGTQTIEPIVQVIVRPSETIGKWPNETSTD